MAKTKRQRREQVARDRERLLDTERENADLREQLVQSRQRPATNAAPLYRQQTVVWDWRCQCGRLVYGGKPTCICRRPRHYGETVIGSIRAVIQDSRAARSAVDRQRCVPGTTAPRQYGGVQSRAASTTPQNTAEHIGDPSRSIQRCATGLGGSGHTPSRQSMDYAGAARRAAQPVHPPAVSAASVVPVGPGSTLDPLELPAQSLQEVLAEHEDFDQEDDPTDQTLPEEVGPKKLQQRSLNLERKRERKELQLPRKEAAIAQQKQQIAEEQAKLVELQSEADEISGQIREVDDVLAEVHLRISQLTAERAHRAEATDALPVQNEAEVQQPIDAATCLVHTFKAVRDYASIQDPQIRALVRSFVTGLQGIMAGEAAKSPTRDPEQSTLDKFMVPHSQIPQPSCQTAAPTGGAVEWAMQFELASGHTTPRASASSQALPPPTVQLPEPAPPQLPEPVLAGPAESSEPQPLQIQGECIGDKRKFEAVSHDKSKRSGHVAGRCQASSAKHARRMAEAGTRGADRSETIPIASKAG